MFRYRVETEEYEEGFGMAADSVRVIDEFDEPTTARNYIESCADGVVGILLPEIGHDLLVRIVDNNTGDIASMWWVGDVYSEWYGKWWLEEYRFLKAKEEQDKEVRRCTQGR